MASEFKHTKSDKTSDSRLGDWEACWVEQDIGFHRSDVHPALLDKFALLESEKKVDKILVPLCGKTLDMKWLADKGVTVVGVDGVLTALQEFFKEQGLEWTEEDAPAMGPDWKLLKSKDGKIRLYCGDMMLFNESIEGQFDAVWDRGSLVALYRKDVPSYVQIIKNVLKSQSKILIEVMEYDLDHPDAIEPPPYPVFEDELKRLFEPDCTLKYLDRNEANFREHSFELCYYIITKV